jgi:mRNA interferase HigB
VRAFDRTADYVGGDRWVFNLRRNRYRLVVRIFFPARQVYVRFIGTHADYDRIADITTI